MSADAISIEETDDVGTPVVTYVCSPAASTDALNSTGRVDLVPPPTAPKVPLLKSVLNAFLPAGYPHSVTDDYLEYQIYDSLQAFSSSIAGLLSSRAVLEGVGVGDSTTSPTAALSYSVLQDSMGQLATIVFAHRLGTALQPECKMYRLAADVFNDMAMILDCLSPVFPRPVRLGVLTLSGVLRALCGVAAGSSKASLSAHFAKWGNIGELNAKDSSQETVISLMGMLVGTMVVSHISSRLMTWISLIFLLLVHITTNYFAVRAVKMTTLNRQRSNIVFSTLFDHDYAPTPTQASMHERIFERDGVLRWKPSSLSAAEHLLGSCRIGVSLDELLRLSSPAISRSTRSLSRLGITVPRLLHIFKNEDYLLWFDKDSKRGSIVLKSSVTATSQLKAWSHALMVSHRVLSIKHRLRSDKKQHGEASDTAASMYKLLEDTLNTHSERFPVYVQKLKDAGWDLDTPALETRPGRRLVASGHEDS